MSIDKEITNLLEKINFLNAGILRSNRSYKHEERKIKSFELIFTTKGTLSLFQENRKINVRENECVILHPDTLHGGLEEANEPLQFFWIHFQIGIRTKKRFTNIFPVGKIYLTKRPEQLVVLIHRLLSEQETNELNDFSANALMKLIFNEILFQKKEENIDHNSENLALKCFYLIKAESKYLTAKSIANHLGYNADYLERVFKRTFKMTLTQKIHEQKIIKSTKLLTENQLNIDQISLECGFKDSNYFRRIFKRFHGVTPKKFKSMHTKIHVIRN